MMKHIPYIRGDEPFKSICFVSPVPFDERDNERHGVNYFRSKGIDVIVCSDWRKGIPEIENCLYITFIDFSWKTYRLYRFLSKHKYAFWKTNIIPMSVSRKIVLASSLKSCIPLPFIKPADYVIVSTDLSKSIMSPIGYRTKVIKTHALDYDIYLKEKSSIVSDEKYVVFLDEHAPFHPDHDILGIPNTLTPEIYYASMNKFFGYIEEKRRCKIKIALHPVSDGKDYFEGREAIKGQTCMMIRDAEFVIAHGSTSLGYAVLYDKPVMLITTDELEGSYMGNALYKMANALGVSVTNIDKKWTMFWDRVDKDYKEKYIKDNDNERFSWEIIYDAIS